MLTTQSQGAVNRATSSSSRLLLVIYLICWLPSMLEAFSGSYPVVTITNQSQEILVLRNDDVVLQFNCTSSGEPSPNMTWVRGGDSMFKFPQDDSRILLTNDSLTLALTINVSEADSDLLASKEGVPYFCLASNELGTARSREVTLRYPSFEGFEDMENETVRVRIGQAVGLSCGYKGTPVPDPMITWFMDEDVVPIDDMKYRLLEKGELVIYELENSDIDTGSGPVEYRCRVDNVRIVENKTSPFFYTLFENGTLLMDPEIYIRPPTSLYLPADESFLVYFILATNGATRLVEGELPTGSDVSVSVEDLAVDIITVTENFVLQIIAGYFEAPQIQFYNPPVVARINISVIEPLMIDIDTTMSEVFRVFSSETDFNFTCIASGTNLRLDWYKNGQLMPVDGTSLIITKATPSDNGVYQCFWTSEIRPSQIFDSVTWAVVVRDRVQPSVINSVINSASSQPADEEGGVIVAEGNTVNISVTVRSDAFPDISWYFENLDGISGPLNTSNMTLYETTNVTDLGEELYQFNLILVRMTVENSGWYSPVIDDGVTEPFVGPMQFISVEFGAEVTSVTSSHNCLLAGEVVDITCNAEGLPEPVITFRKGSIVVDPDNNCQSCNITNNVLTFYMVTPDDEGPYGCTAENQRGGMPVDSSGNLNDGLPFLYCDHPTVSVVGSTSINVSEGDEVTLTCEVNSTPAPEVTWLSNGMVVNDDSDGYETIQSGNRYSLVIISPTTANTGTYTCQVNNTAIPEVVMAQITLTVNSNRLPVYAYAVIAVGGVLLIAILIALMLLCCCCYCSKKTGSYSASGARGILSRDEYDGRGNVDRDSDEEDGKGEEPEAFQPQYESLPALRPAAPPQYKPSPAYGGQTEVEMVKMPIPDTESTAFEFSPGPPPLQGYVSRPDNGNVVGDGHGGSAVGLQARFEDFMSDDGQFV